MQFLSLLKMATGVLTLIMTFAKPFCAVITFVTRLGRRAGRYLWGLTARVVLDVFIVCFAAIAIYTWHYGGEWKACAGAVLFGVICLAKRSMMDAATEVAIDDRTPSALMRRGWSRDMMAADADGNLVPSSDPAAVAWSIVGAAFAAWGDSRRTADFLARVGSHVGQPADWNRSASQTQAVAVAEEIERSYKGVPASWETKT